MNIHFTPDEVSFLYGLLEHADHPTLRDKFKPKQYLVLSWGDEYSLSSQIITHFCPKGAYEQHLRDNNHPDVSGFQIFSISDKGEFVFEPVRQP